MQTAQTVAIRLLGPIGAAGSHGEIELGGPRQRRLLGVLALRTGQRIDAGELIDAVWADGGLPADPREALRTYVSRLRRSLGNPESVVGRGGTYTLSIDPAGVDVTMFESLIGHAGAVAPVERLETALSLWRGPALAGFEHEDWARPYAARLTELKLLTGDDLAEAYLQSGRAAEAVAFLDGLVESHPLRERTHALLMTALDRCGRTGEALRVFHDYRRRLATDLGLGPGDRMVALERAIATGGRPAAHLVHHSAPGYQLLERIGSGSFGEVHRAIQPSLDREVAIKSLRNELVDRPEFIGRFEDEARLVARLEHPNIVPLYDYWREPGCAFLVMRWMRGGSLDRPLSSPSWPLARTTALVCEIGAALGAAHRVGVVHRDVKPGNVLLDDLGHAYLADFGIAHNVDGPSPAPTDSAMYVPPELTRGDPVGPAGDVYGLALVVYRMLASQGPARTRTGDCRISCPGPRPIDGSPDEVDEAVFEVLARATATDPADRFADIAEFVEAFCLAAGVRTDGPSPAPAGSAGRSAGRAGTEVVGRPLPGIVVVAT